MENQPQKDSKFPKSIGAIWVKESKAGKPYAKIVVTVNGVEHSFVAWKNKYKNQDKHPDWQIFPAVDKKGPERSITENFSQEEDVPF